MPTETNFAPNLGEFLELPSLTIRQLYTSVGAPTGSAPEGSINITSAGAIYMVQGGVWTLLSSGGGGSGDANWSGFSGAYGAGNPPTDTPTTTRAIGYNTSDGSVSYWYSGSWH